jgi:hypothetical protein
VSPLPVFAVSSKKVKGHRTYNFEDDGIVGYGDTYSHGSI